MKETNCTIKKIDLLFFVEFMFIHHRYHIPEVVNTFSMSANRYVAPHRVQWLNVSPLTIHINKFVNQKQKLK